MKKVLLSIFAIAVLAGCSSYYDYYKAGVRYVQSGPDCIFYTGERGRHFSEEILGLDTGKKIVYRNTLCANLYDKDMMGQPARQDRRIFVPAAAEVPYESNNNSCSFSNAAPADDFSCGCNSCTRQYVAPVVKRKYIVVTSM